MAFAAFLLNFRMPFYERARHDHALEYILRMSRSGEYAQADKDQYPAGQSVHSRPHLIQMHRDDVDDRRGNQEEEHGQVQQMPERK